MPQPLRQKTLITSAFALTRTVVSGIIRLKSDLASGRLAPRLPSGRAAELAKLPPRLQQVLELLAAGWNIKEAAGRLGISQKTAEAHRAKLLRRLGVKSVVEAVHLKLGFARPPKKPGPGSRATG